MHRVWSRVEEFSLLLLAGAVIALVWANVAPGSYHGFVEHELWRGGPIGHLHDGERVVTFHFLVNDLLMALFFALAGKEVWEAVALPGGSLRGRRALTPLVATAGGMLGPVLVYLLGAALVGQFAELHRGWAIPTATDIAFSFLVGRLVFGAAHPAVSFLLLLAIADDAAGLVILAVFYPTGTLAPAWLILSFAAAVAVWFVFNRMPSKGAGGPGLAALAQAAGPWPYVIAGLVGWYGFQQAGVHPALGLLPVIPAIPHAATDAGPFAEIEDDRPDLLNRLEHALKAPVQLVLFLFGLCNAGVEFSAVAAPTWLVLSGLIIGKPLGIFTMGWLAARPLGFGLPDGMDMRDVLALGCVAAIGFTVSLFVAAVAFPPGPVQDAAKMGALLSFGAAPIAMIVGRLVGVRRAAAPA